MVHRREVNGQEIVLGNQGALFGNAMTWWDHDTGSVWSQPTGAAILGPRSGERLELLSSTLTDWRTWRHAHPETRALDADGGPTAFDIDHMQVAIELAGDALAVPVAAMREAGVINTEVGGVPVAFVAEPVAGGWWAVYYRRLDDRVVLLTLRDGVLTEADGPGRWDPVRGLPLAGDERLDPLGALTIFPRDFPVHFPHGRVWSP